MTMSLEFWLEFFESAGFNRDQAVNYGNIFCVNRIQLEHLPNFDREMLREMNITAMGDIVTILTYIKKICGVVTTTRSLPVIENPIYYQTTHHPNLEDYRNKDNFVSSNEHPNIIQKTPPSDKPVVQRISPLCGSQQLPSHCSSTHYVPSSKLPETTKILKQRTPPSVFFTSPVVPLAADSFSAEDSFVGEQCKPRSVPRPNYEKSVLFPYSPVRATEQYDRSEENICDLRVPSAEVATNGDLCDLEDSSDCYTLDGEYSELEQTTPLSLQNNNTFQLSNVNPAKRTLQFNPKATSYNYTIEDVDVRSEDSELPQAEPRPLLNNNTFQLKNVNPMKRIQQLNPTVTSLNYTIDDVDVRSDDSELQQAASSSLLNNNNNNNNTFQLRNGNPIKRILQLNPTVKSLKYISEDVDASSEAASDEGMNLDCSEDLIITEGEEALQRRRSVFERLGKRPLDDEIPPKRHKPVFSRLGGKPVRRWPNVGNASYRNSYNGFNNSNFSIKNHLRRNPLFGQNRKYCTEKVVPSIKDYAPVEVDYSNNSTEIHSGDASPELNGDELTNFPGNSEVLTGVSTDPEQSKEDENYTYLEDDSEDSYTSKEEDNHHSSLQRVGAHVNMQERKYQEDAGIAKLSHEELRAEGSSCVIRSPSPCFSWESNEAEEELEELKDSTSTNHSENYFLAWAHRRKHAYSFSGAGPSFR